MHRFLTGLTGYGYSGILHPMNFRTRTIFGLLSFLTITVSADRVSKHTSGSDTAPEFLAGGTIKRTTASFAPLRTRPVQQGEFQVDLVVITFPDCKMPESIDYVREGLSRVKGGTIEDYYKDYSQGITWPVLAAYPTIYTAPHPLGYYCRWDFFANPLGYKGDEGGARAHKLCEDALRTVRAANPRFKKGTYTCYVYCPKLTKDSEVLERLIRPHYPAKPSPVQLEAGVKDKMSYYNPPIRWRDPLWPNSKPQVHYPADGGTLVHELGHCLGSPDFYHASEEHDGVSGTPCLPWSYGPTGPAYCRVIHHAFVPATAYPKITSPGDVTLSPRSAQFPTTKKTDFPPLGVFVPSSHPNYLFCIEYCHNEKPPVGHSEAEGLLIHAINVTLSSPMMGPPDLCYTYRADDPDHKGNGKGGAFLQPGDTFDAKSDPAAVLPNLLPAGIAITDIRCNENGTCTFKLDFPPTKFSKQELDYSLLPQTKIIRLSNALPTSFRAEMDVLYRGEPLLTEYGFCYGLRKDPTEKTGKLFPLHHRDRYDARLIDLKPGSMYYVRAYARNANGIRYSSTQRAITLPFDTPDRRFSATLFSESDHLLSNWYYQKWYFGTHNDNIINSANPLFAFMALANYYRVLPGGSLSAGRRTPSHGIDLTRVHSYPSDSRPKFRLAETEKLRNAVRQILANAGLSQDDFIPKEGDENGKKGKKKRVSVVQSSSHTRRGPFDELTPWVKKCATALNIKTPEKTFFVCREEEDLLKLAPEIRRWILLSQPVIVVRENFPMSDEISERWPLDIAFIDGLGEDAESFHVVFPGGSDRGTHRKNGEMRLEKLLDRTTKAIVMFYRPGPPMPPVRLTQSASAF